MITDKTQMRIKISADFTITMLLAIGGSILSLKRYLEERKVDGLYTEAWFLGKIVFLLRLCIFYTRPKVILTVLIFIINELTKTKYKIHLKYSFSFHNLFFMVEMFIHMKSNTWMKTMR
jgi:hypothetical protein